MSRPVGRGLAALPEPPYPTLRLGTVALHRINERETVAYTKQELAAGRGGWIVTPNLDIVRQCAEEPEIDRLIASAQLRVADGMPLIWASQLVGDPLPERVCGSNLIYSLSEMARADGWSVFLLGGAGDVAVHAAARLAEHYPGLRIAGTYSPPFGFEKDPASYDRMRQMLVDNAPDIVFVALGFPKAEKLIDALRPARPNAWYIGVGISFAFVTGEVQRAPQWMQDVGLEWLHRMSREPQRLFTRYVMRDIPYAVRFFRDALTRRIAGEP